MKKIVILSLALLICSQYVLAKDYAKLQIKEMKHAQKYATTQKVLQNNNQKISINVLYMTLN